MDGVLALAGDFLDFVADLVDEVDLLVVLGVELRVFDSICKY